ncbi:enoyl-CoA hydratase/isomerase family protein [Sphingosinicella sp. BN140058]|uniref:enoyl-CoA hydratase/isomerase family protein n=1 Tax=Sphingosinicella sp. BN140058 TaxID=1892855 RepID=UPI0010137E03|nr:enoyl-CoA hydratase/isomerase family protein [Sphingosinicella sp. BN140058]QAY75231.1 enoyl-CoA hydratase/isomerase family protein [Sphingosinicella sp. BN140058]
MSADVLTMIEGRVARIRLNRPKAIHALTRDMCSAMIAALLEWRENPAIEAVLIDHAEGRGFCAGGDVVMLAKSGETDGAQARDFFHEEYRLNHLLFTFMKPVVAFMDGITMGGGVGISQPAKYRVATENSRFAMPETTIGLFPDVGGGWYLSRLPGRVGQFLALTGARLDGAECLRLGLATHYLPAAALDGAKAAIAADPQRIEEILREASVAPPDARIEANLPSIDQLFASDDYEEILAALEADGSDWAQTELDTLRAKSPQACKVSLRLLYDGARVQDFAHEMRQEYAVAARVVQRNDFVEGVRALLIDKDNAPRWSPATPDGVSDHMIDQIFAPMPEGEEWTPLAL